MKYVYFFGAGKSEGTGDMREVLGGKGAGLAEMTRIGLPVPAGFTITTEACAYFYEHDKKYPKELKAELLKNVEKLEKVTKKKLGDANDPLLVSVRSGSARSMPGMMETILNLGLNSKSVEGLAKATNNDRFAWDAYRRFVQMYSSVVIGLPKDDLETRLRNMKNYLGVKDDTEVTAQGWRQLVGEYKAYFKEKKIRSSSCGAPSAPCSVRGWAKRPSPIAAWRRSQAFSAQPST
jgi:pyruvate,orthophosphate dikinase